MRAAPDSQERVDENEALELPPRDDGVHEQVLEPRGAVPGHEHVEPGVRHVPEAPAPEALLLHPHPVEEVEVGHLHAVRVGPQKAQLPGDQLHDLHTHRERRFSRATRPAGSVLSNRPGVLLAATGEGR